MSIKESLTSMHILVTTLVTNCYLILKAGSVRLDRKQRGSALVFHHAYRGTSHSISGCDHQGGDT